MDAFAWIKKEMEKWLWHWWWSLFISCPGTLTCLLCIYSLFDLLLLVNISFSLFWPIYHHSKFIVLKQYLHFFITSCFLFPLSCSLLIILLIVPLVEWSCFYCLFLLFVLEYIFILSYVPACVTHVLHIQCHNHPTLKTCMGPTWLLIKFWGVHRPFM